jgi:hypothetical protein
MKRLEFLFVSILFFVGCIALYLHVLVSGEDTVTKLRKVRRETPLLSTVKITMQIENISHPLATLATLATLVNKSRYYMCSDSYLQSHRLCSAHIKCLERDISFVKHLDI